MWQATHVSSEEQTVASQSRQQTLPLSAMSAWSHIRPLFHLARIESPPWGPRRPPASALVFFLKFHSSKRKSNLCKCLQHYFFNSGVWIWGWHCLLVQSFLTHKLEHSCGIQFTLITTNTLETKRGQHVTLNRDQYKVLVFCWVSRQTANNYPFSPQRVTLITIHSEKHL